MDTNKKKGIFSSIAELISPYFPDLKKTLKLADLDDDPSEYLEKAVRNTLLISAGVLFVIYAFLILFGGILNSKDTLSILPQIILPLIFIPIIVFFYVILYAKASVLRREKELDYEIVFAGRHLAIAVKSGMPLFDALVGATTGYGSVSKEFTKIVDQVVLGVPISQAIRETTQYNPSKYFNRIMIQISNSLSSGADLGTSLESVLDQISKEQMISLREYSQKLTPLVMFYMVFGIIVPSLGVVLATVIFSAVSGGRFGFTSSLLILVFFMIAVVQYLFLGAMESSRPKYLI